MTTKEPIVLLVDDSANDAQLMRIAFERAGFAHPLHHVFDGDEAIAYLQGTGRYTDRTQFPLPNVVLMDLNMPRKNGFEVLTWIRDQPVLCRLRVYILSASSREPDIDRSFELGASSYLVKPSTLDELLVMTKCLGGWLKLSHFSSLQGADAGRDAVTASERKSAPIGIRLAG
jgi:CheY-like chemotaxis protein